jgi:hypothetical protein
MKEVDFFSEHATTDQEPVATVDEHESLTPVSAPVSISNGNGTAKPVEGLGFIFLYSIGK